jgi:molybdopterin molybdotransferase
MPPATENDHCTKETAGKLSVKQALDQVRSISVDLKSNTASTPETLGRVLAEPMDVRENLPRFDQSAMDGYAVKSEDLEEATETNPVTLPCNKQAAAGGDQTVTVPSGEAARIFTGAPVPEGANAVVIQEKVERQNETVNFFEPVEPGANIRRRGEEMQAGDSLMDGESIINAGAIGLLLSQGYETVKIVSEPRVAIVATGDELIDPTESPSRGQKRDTNSAIIQTLLTNYTDTIEVHRINDRRDAVRNCLENCLNKVDLMFVSGGVSVGDRDFVRPVLDELGVEEIFWRVNQKPGKPLYLGETDSTQVMGLPGNPVSASVCFYVYGIPLVRKKLGYPEDRLELDRGKTRLTEHREHPKTRTEFVRARTVSTDQGYRSRILENQGSHMLSGLAEANSLLILEESRDLFTPDQELPCYFLEDSGIPHV